MSAPGSPLPDPLPAVTDVAAVADPQQTVSGADRHPAHVPVTDVLDT